jgi:hypothetical protein
MPTYHSVPFDLDEGIWTFLRQSKVGFSASTIDRACVPTSAPRQLHFQSELQRLKIHFSGHAIPVFLDFPSKKCVRLDKGCIGHAIANGVLRHPRNGPKRIVEEVEFV